MNDQLRQLTARAISGLRMLLGRGRITLTNDDGQVQIIQARVSAKELMNIPRLSEFGFASRIPENGDVAIIFLNAERTNGIVVASGHQSFRFKLANDGETAIYDAFGKSIWLKKEGGITVEAADQPVIINGASAVNLTGAGGRKVVCDGDPVVGGVVQADPNQKVTAS